MYHAIMTYHFKPEHLESAISLWKSGVASLISKQPGFVDVKFYTDEKGTAIAIGTWESEEYANLFMKTGIFADLLKSFNNMMSDLPRGGAFDLVYSESKK
jgi:heme-degrading monooxygenase HmoA